MNSSLVKRALQIVEEALELPAEARDGFVERTCGGQGDLKQEVEAMLVFDKGVSIDEPELSNLHAKIDEDLRPSQRYEIREELGRGGMGTVYRAYDRQLDREVAVKVLRVRSSRSQSMQERFALEAQIGARLQHPGVAAVHDLGRLPDGRAFLAMKLVRGETLSSFLAARADLTEDRPRLLNVFESLCQTIAYAHTHGIIHRDLKPDNVMVGEFGEVQVMDWGLATSVSTEQLPSYSNDTATDYDLEPAPIRSTRSGVIAGTPAYMSPEQATGQPDRRTDVFALGAILCEILTGDPPYVARSSREVYEKSINAELDDAFRRLNRSEADAEIGALAKDCLQPDREDRPLDANAVTTRITQYRQSVQARLQKAEVSAAQARIKFAEQRKQRRIVLASGVVGLVFVIALLAGWVQRSAERVRHSEQLTLIERQKSASLESQVYRLHMTTAFAEFDGENFARTDQILDEISPDKRTWEWRYLRARLDQSIQRFPLSTSALAGAIVGPEQLVLALDEQNRVHIWDPISRKKVSEKSRSGLPIALAPNRRHVLSSDQYPFLWDGLTGEVLREFQDWPTPHRPGIFAFRRSAISANAKHIAYLAHRQLHLFNGHSGELLTKIPIKRLLSVRFSTDGCWLVWIDGMKIHFWDIEAGQSPRPPITYESVGNAGGLAIAADKSMVAMSSRDHVAVWDLETDEMRKLHADRHTTALTDALVCFNENATRLLTVSNNDAIRIWDPRDGTHLRTLSRQPGYVRSFRPSCYMDERIVLATRDGVRLWDIRDHSPLTLRGHTSFVYPVNISPDDTTIASGGWDRTLRVWSLSTGQEKWATKKLDGYIYDLDFDEQGQRIVSGSAKGTACIWHVSNGDLIREVKVSGEISGAKYVRDNKILLVHGNITLRDKESLEEVKRTDSKDAVYLGRDSQSDRFVTRGDNTAARRRIVSLWNLSELRPYAVIEARNIISAATFSPDGELLLLGDEKGEISVWDAEDPQKPLRVIPAHSSEIFSLRFLGEQRRLLSAGRDAVIRVWDFQTGDVVGYLRGHDDYVYSLAVTSDAECVVSGSGDNTIRIWESTPLRERLQAIRAAESNQFSR